MCAAGEVKATPRVNPWNEIVDELVARRSFYLLLAEEEDSCRRFATVLKKLEPLPSVDENQQRVVEGSSERIVHLIYSSPQPAPWKANDFTSRGWEIDSTNVYREFSRVAEVLFEDEINWGRIVAFLGFAVSFSVYAVQKGLQESVFESVLGWTVQVMQGRLKSWLREHSWESFITYADRVLQKANHQPSVFDSIRRVGMTVGAVGLGTVLAIAFRHAFS